MPDTDFIIGTMALLKNKWSLATPLDSGSIKFTTGYYGEQINLPMISVTPFVEPHKPMSIGSTPTYMIYRTIQIQVWVRPDTFNNASLGRAKNTRYQLIEEVQRILRTNPTAIPGMKFVVFGETFSREDLKIRPPILTTEIRAKLIDFKNPNLGVLPPIITIFDPNIFDSTIYS